MTYYLGIDGGGTGCRAALADASGRILGRGEAASANIFTNPHGARDNILRATRQALEDSGRDARLPDLCAVLGIAGANVPEAAARLRAGLPFVRLRVENDAVIAAKGALGDTDGVTATLGTGSVFAAQRGGAVRIIGGWGFLLGDLASGARMGRMLLEAALLAHDGLATGSLLTEAVIAERGGPAHLVLQAQSAAPADFARLAPRILAAAADGDRVAAGILAEAEAAVITAIDRLSGGQQLPICFLGGLGPAFAERLGERYAGRLRAPAGSALDGALALARGL